MPDAHVTVALSASPAARPLAAANIAWQVADNVNGNKFVLGNKQLLMLNTAAGTPTVTVSSVANRLGRTEDLVITLAAAGSPGECKRLGKAPDSGWAQTDRELYFLASTANVKFALIDLG